jgi:hypothetical protein
MSVASSREGTFGSIVETQRRGSPRLTLGQWIQTVIVPWRGGVDVPAPPSTD